MVAPEEGMLTGKVISVVFKGIHYQIIVKVGKNEIEIQSTRSKEVDEVIGMNIYPDGIHVMKKEFTSNVFNGVITKKNTVEFGDGEFKCDLTKLYPGSHMDDEGYLITAKGKKIDLTGVEVTAEVGLHDIQMSDNLDEGAVQGEIISLVYIGDHYRYTVRTENEEDYVFACDDLWNEHDKVSLIIPTDNIRLTLKKQEDE